MLPASIVQVARATVLLAPQSTGSVLPGLQQPDPLARHTMARHPLARNAIWSSNAREQPMHGRPDVRQTLRLFGTFQDLLQSRVMAAIPFGRRSE